MRWATARNTGHDEPPDADADTAARFQLAACQFSDGKTGNAQHAGKQRNGNRPRMLFGGLLTGAHGLQPPPAGAADAGQPQRHAQQGQQACADHAQIKQRNAATEQAQR
jgi:hypothetical protein